MRLHNALSAFILMAAVMLSINCSTASNTDVNVVNANANKQNVNFPAINASPTAVPTVTANNSNANTVNNQKTDKNDKQAASNGETGVKECDDYIAKYEVCLNTKVPQAQQALLKPRFEQQHQNFKELANMPDGKKGLADTCRMITNAIKGATAQYGCAW